MFALAKKKPKKAAGAAARKKKNKQERQSAQQAAAGAPPKAEESPAGRRRAEGGVPPADAFNNLKQRRPPAHMLADAELAQGGEAPREEAPPRKGKKKKKPERAAKPSGNKGKKAGPSSGPKKQPDAQEKDDAPSGRGASKGEAHSGNATPKPVNPTRRRRQRRLAAILGIIVLIGLGAWFSVSVLFKIEKFEVQGECPYSVDEIAAVFGHAVGDNLYGFSVANAKERIETSLPYIETVTIHRRPPSTVLFRVEMAQEAYYFSHEGGFAILSSSRKVLRTTAEEPVGLMRINGLAYVNVVPGLPLSLSEEAVVASSLAASAASEAAAYSIQTESTPSSSAPAEDPSSSDPYANMPEGFDPGYVAGEGMPPASAAEGETQWVGEEGEEPVEETLPEPAAPADPASAAESFAVLQVLLDAIEASGLTEVDWVDVNDPLNLAFSWQGRITVKLGAKGNLEEKMKVVVVLLTDEEQGMVHPEDRGTLDMGYYMSTGKAFFDRS